MAESCADCLDECAEKKKEIEEETDKLDQMRKEQLWQRFSPPDELLASDGMCSDIGLGPGSGSGAMHDYVLEHAPSNSPIFGENVGNPNAVTKLGHHKNWVDGTHDARTVPWCNLENQYVNQSAALEKKIEEYEKSGCPPLRRTTKNEASQPAPTPDEYLEAQTEKGQRFGSWIGGFIPGVSQGLSALEGWNIFTGP